jgi:hypothetical protein
MEVNCALSSSEIRPGRGSQFTIELVASGEKFATKLPQDRTFFQGGHKEIPLRRCSFDLPANFTKADQCDLADAVSSSSNEDWGDRAPMPVRGMIVGTTQLEHGFSVSLGFWEETSHVVYSAALWTGLESS